MALWVAVPLLGILIGTASHEVRRFERIAAGHIADRLQGDAKQVQVQVKFEGYVAGPLGDLRSATIRAREFSTDGLPLFTEPEGPRSGRIRSLELELDNFNLRGLRMRRLRASLPECRFDYGLALRRREIRLTHSGEGEGWVEITAEDLAEFILNKYREIKRVSVEIWRDRVVVEGYGEFLIINSDFRVTARLVPIEGRRLMLDEAFIWFGEALADAATEQVLLNLLNPVVDLDTDLGLHGAMDIKGLYSTNNVLRAWGTTRIPNRPDSIPNS